MQATAVKIAMEDEAGRYRNLTEVSPQSDGGFSVLVPNHCAGKRFLAKAQLAKRSGGNILTRPSPLLVGPCSDGEHVRLVFHLDGFIQIVSDSKVLSGRDPSGQALDLAITQAKAVGSDSRAGLQHGRLRSRPIRGITRFTTFRG